MCQTQIHWTHRFETGDRLVRHIRYTLGPPGQIFVICSRCHPASSFAPFVWKQTGFHFLWLQRSSQETQTTDDADIVSLWRALTETWQQLLHKTDPCLPPRWTQSEGVLEKWLTDMRRHRLVELRYGIVVIVSVLSSQSSMNWHCFYL